MSKFYLTTPIYYVNAPPHIGHAYTTLAADVIARYYKEKLGESNVFFLTGTDEHGAKIAEAAEREGKSPKTFCDEMAPLFQQTWQRLNISYTHFIRTTDEYHEKGAAEFLTALKLKGALYESAYKGLYCNACESFITEKQLTKDGLCKDHLRSPERIVEKNWFFKLETYLPKVQKIIEDGTLRVLPETRTEEVLGLFRQGMENFSVSRPNVRWGIPLPWDRAQTIYVWVEALLNYWTAIHKCQKFWPPNVQIIGKDIIKFHCIYWPAMLLAYYDGDTEQLPKTIFAHGFFTVNGQKMSKTLGNVIDPNDLVDRYGSDGARYLILSQFPFGADGDIEESKFTEKYNADLANGLGNEVSRIATVYTKKIAKKDKDGIFWTKVREKYERNKTQDVPYINQFIKTLQLYEALQCIKGSKDKPSFEVTGYATGFSSSMYITNRDLNIDTPWLEQDLDKVIDGESKAMARLLVQAYLLRPFLPQTSEKVEQIFDIQNKKITLVEALFPRKS